MGSVFKFKQFEVDQAGCAMRINTDGVLLALLAENSGAKRILDIGTGTGVIALMLAQRYPEAEITAVEIDKQASLTAGNNFVNSVFCDRLTIHNTAIEHFSSSLKFDLIVSNPPFFVNDLKSAEEKKGIARHTNAVFFDDLLAKVVSLLSVQGRFWFVLPVKQAELLVEKAKNYELNAVKQVFLHSDARKPEFRRVVCLGRSEEIFAAERFNIYESEKVYTQSYRALLKDFFLAY